MRVSRNVNSRGRAAWRREWLLLLALLAPLAMAQVRMEIEITPFNPEPGERVLIRVVASNAGAVATGNLRVEVDFPAGLADMGDAFFSDGGNCTNVSGSSSFCDAGEVAFWDIGALPPGDGRVVYFSPVIDATVTGGDSVVFDGRVLEGASALASTQEFADIVATRALELGVDPNQDPLAPGQPVSYTLSFANRGSLAATQTELRFPLPTGATLIAADGDGVPSGSSVVWDLGVVNPGESGTRTVWIQPDAALADGDVIKPFGAVALSGLLNGQLQFTRQSAVARLRTAHPLQFSIDLPAQPLRSDQVAPVHLTVTNRSAAIQSGIRAQLYFPPGLADMGDAFFSDGGDCTVASGSSASCSAGETAIWNIGALAPGAGKTVTLVPMASATVPDGQLLSLLARAVVDDSPDLWDRHSMAIQNGRVFDLEIDADREPVAPAATLSYAISFGNRSAIATTASELRLPLPGGANLVSVSDGGQLVDGVVVWPLGTLNPGDSGMRMLTIELGSAIAEGELVEVRGAEISADSAFRRERTMQQAITRVQSDTDLAFSIDLPAAPLRADLLAPIHLTVTNRGTSLRTGVRAELFFAPGLATMGDGFLGDGGDCTSAAGSSASCSAGETAFWDIGNLAPGTGKTVTLVPSAAAINADGRLIALFGRAFADGTTDFWERRTMAMQADRLLDLEIDADREPVAPGAVLNYTASYGNPGATAVSAAELRIALPPGTDLVAASNGGQLLDGEVVWDLGTLDPGDSGKRFLTVGIAPQVAAGDVLALDVAEIRGSSAFGIERTRQQVATRVQPGAELVLSIDLPAQPMRSDLLSPIHLTVTNRGVTQRTGVRAELFFPPGLASMSDGLISDAGDCSSAAGSSAFCDGGEMAFWNIGTLAPGAGRTVTLTPQVPAAGLDGGLISFFARAAAAGTGDFWQRKTLGIAADRALDLEVDVLRAPIVTAVPGEPLVYTLTFGNPGASTVDNAVLRAPLPSSTSLIAADGNGALIGDEVVWALGSLEPGDVGHRTLELGIDPLALAGDVVEVPTARIESDGQPLVWNDESARLRADDDFDLGLSLQPDRALPGQSFIADLTIDNNTPVLISNVSAELYFPSWLNDLPDGEIPDGGNCNNVFGASSFCDSGEIVIWNLASVPAMTRQLRTIQPTVAGPPLGTVIPLFARIRSSAVLDGAFVERALAVGNFLPPPPPPEPEIEVLGNGQVIESGDLTPSPADGTDFLVHDINDPVPPRALFVIENSGDAVLTIAAATISGPNAADFRFPTGLPASIEPAQQATFAIDFTPGNLGIRSAIVTIQNNDTDENPYSFAIQGEGVDPTGQLMFRDGFE